MTHILKTTMGAAILLAGMAFAAPAIAKPLIPLDQCWVQPNSGKYVTRHGQIDCYTGKFASVEANAGNNIGTSPQSRKAKPSRNDKLHDRIDRQSKRAHQDFAAAYNYAKAAKAAARARDWSGWRSNTRSAIASTKAGIQHKKNAARLESKLR